MKDMSAINDPLGQTYSLAGTEHGFSLGFVLLNFEKWDRTDNICENNDPYNGRAVTVGRPRGSMKGYIGQASLQSKEKKLIKSRYFSCKKRKSLTKSLEIAWQKKIIGH